MKGLSFSLMFPALLLLLATGCGAELGQNMPMEQRYENESAGQLQPGREGVGPDYAMTERWDSVASDTVPDTGGAGLEYDRGREDHPGQSYAEMLEATDPKSRSGGITGTQLASGISTGGIAIRSIKTPVRRGDTGSLSLQGRANTQYTITAVYKNDNDTVTSTVVKRSDNNGIVDLEWAVGTQTVPGTYGIMITGGSEQISTSYTVVE